MFPNGAEFLSCYKKFYVASGSHKSRGLSSSAISQLSSSADDGSLDTVACGNADAEVNVSQWF